MQVKLGEPRSDVTTVHHCGPSGCWATRGRRILHSPSTDGDWKERGAFPAAWPLDLLGPVRASRRVLRLDKCNLWPTRAGALLGLRAGCAWRLDPEGLRAPVPLFSIEGDCVMNRAIGEDAVGNLYFGAYFMNPGRAPVKIYRVDPELRRHSVAYTFTSPRIRHVHAVHADPYRPERLWVTMGDFEGECFIAYTDDGFDSLRVLGDGDQLWRAVGLLFFEDRLAWLTDSHIAQNKIVSMDRRTEKLEVHGDRDASSWFMARTRDGLCLATTTVEPGPSIETNRVRLLASENAVEWETVAEFEKDAYPMRFFGFGSLWLPGGEIGADGFWLAGEGIKGFDGSSRLCSLERSP